jgi:hypothetical protein
MPTKPGLVSQRKYAQFRGLSHQAVNKAVRSGRIPSVDGKIDPVAADAAWERNTRPGPGNGSNGRPTRSATKAEVDAGNGHDLAATERPHATYSAARALREVYLAKRAKLEFEAAEGNLVSVEEVKARAFEAARALREQLLALPPRLAPVLFAAPDVATCHRLLEKALLDVCSGISLEDAAAKRRSAKRGRTK